MDDATALRALFLDMGGVLVIPHNSPQRQYWLDRLGREDVEFGAWLWNTPVARAAMRGEILGTEFWRAVGDELGLSAEESDALGNDYFAGDERNELAVALATQCREHGMSVGLISNAYCDLDELLDRYDVRDLFDVVVNSSVEHLTKPDAAIYHLACRRLDVRPVEALLVDDRRDNVEGARQAGLRALCYVGEETLADAARLLRLAWHR